MGKSPAFLGAGKTFEIRRPFVKGLFRDFDLVKENARYDLSLSPIPILNLEGK